jgi:predicted phosphodiesterase
MKALISDIHGNFEALKRVCADIEDHQVDQVLCLGDIVGYGPEPEACTDFIMQKAGITITGNHDFALIFGPIGFNPIAADLIRLTQARMDPQKQDKHIAKEEKKAPRYFPCCREGQDPACMIMRHKTPERWKFIESLPQTHRDGDLLYVHGSVLEPVFEYVFPDKFQDLWDTRRLGGMFAKIDRLCFCGHTHHPCAIADDFRCIYPERTEYRLALDPARKYIFNLGSVGQPRDGDNRACYLLFDEKANTVEWRRVEYDIEATVKKVEAMCGGGNWCGERLRVGR